MTALGEKECWDLLEQERIGRLRYRLVDELHVVPVNYVAREGALFVATGEGDKMLAAELGGEAALEIDDVAGEDAWSVLVGAGCGTSTRRGRRTSTSTRPRGCRRSSTTSSSSSRQW